MAARHMYRSPAIAQPDSSHPPHSSTPCSAPGRLLTRQNEVPESSYSEVRCRLSTKCPESRWVKLVAGRSDKKASRRHPSALALPSVGRGSMSSSKLHFPAWRLKTPASLARARALARAAEPTAPVPWRAGQASSNACRSGAPLPRRVRSRARCASVIESLPCARRSRSARRTQGRCSPDPSRRLAVTLVSEGTKMRPGKREPSAPGNACSCTNDDVSNERSSESGSGQRKLSITRTGCLPLPIERRSTSESAKQQKSRGLGISW
mmetsp:Transcript_35495/g.117632  ORF Transcript_35495/g.117632 Transcript_35495/m.117632 type:complete len:265 (+) Transcript_35495:736-1530(+)